MGFASTGYARLGVLLAAAMLVVLPVYAEDKGEFYVNTYRSIGSVSPKGIRSSGMGGAGRGLADGAASLGVNPAALGALQGSDVDVGLGYDWLDDGYDDTDQVTFRLGGAVSLESWKPTGGPNQAIGGLLYTQSYSGASNVKMKRDQTGVLMGYGLHLMDDVLAGVSVALYDGKWKSDPVDAGGSVYLDRKFTGGDFKVGALYRFCDETTMGGTLGYSTASFKDKAAYATGSGSGSLDRWSIGMGMAHQYAEETLLLGDLWFDRVKTDIPGAIDERNTAWGLSVGVEQQVLPEVMALRGGLYYDHTSYKSSGDVTFLNNGAKSFSKGRFGITAGVGVKVYSFDIGYSLDVNSGGDVKNLLDLSTEW